MFALIVLGGRADAVAVWPNEPDWQALTFGGGNYWDPTGDQSPKTVDMVGNATYASGYWYQSEIADQNQLSLRMRVDGDGSNSRDVWQFLFDTDNDATTIDWVLEVRQSGNPSGRQVMLTSATTGGPTFGDVVLSSSFAWTGTLADWTRWSAAGDGSNFGGNTDYFLDVAIPLDLFLSITTPNDPNAFRIGLSTSTSHTQLNKDLPADLNSGSPISGSMSGAIPEPNTAAMLALGLAALALRGRRSPRA